MSLRAGNVNRPSRFPQRRSADSPGLSALIPQVQERSENPGYKLPGWDATWGTCLEQSLFKINPRRLKMEKMLLFNCLVRNLFEAVKSKNP